VVDEPGEVVIEGEVERVTFESATSSFRVVKLAVDGRKERLAVVGSFPPVAAGSRLRVRGLLVNDKKHGEQLQAKSVSVLSPSTLVGIERYLGSGMIKGVGETYARRIVATFGLDTLRVLDDQPERLAEVGGLGQKRIEGIIATWKEQRSIREVMVFLQAHGASPALAARIWKRYGSDAASVVAREPYRMANDVWGVGFKTADRIAAELGIAKDSPQRLQAGVLQTLRDARDAGHTYAPRDELLTRAAELLDVPGGGDDAAPRAALEHAVEALAMGRYVVPETVQDTRIVYASDMYAAESRLGWRLAEMARAGTTPLAGASSRSGPASRWRPSSATRWRRRPRRPSWWSPAGRGWERRPSCVPSSPCSTARASWCALPRRPAAPRSG
jgi:exodeoxyribonuclease V alpha subunit